LSYELLTLREPRLNEAARSQQAEVPPPSWLDGRFDARLDSLIMRGLDPRPNHRWQDCEQFIDAIRDWLSGQEGGAPSMDELQNVVRMLYMKDRDGFRLEAPPFTDEFALNVLDEAELETASAQPLTLKPRPPFGNGPISMEDLDEATGVRHMADTPSNRTRSELPIHPAFAPLGPLLTPPLPPGLRSSSSQRSGWSWFWWLLTVSIVAVFCLWWFRHG
jgi:hypothetical protein